MRTRTFNSITQLLRDREWHTAGEVAERTRYPSDWIDELERESLLETDARGGEMRVRLKATPGPHSRNLSP